MSLASNVLIGVSIEDLECSHNLLLVFLGRAVTHVVEYLVPNLFAGVFRQFEDSGPKLRDVTFNLARAHHLGSPQTNCFVFAAGKFDQLLHVLGSLESFKLLSQLLLGALLFFIPVARFGLDV